jgi:hypothetical protein
VRFRLLSFSPGNEGCYICGSTDKGDLQSPGFGSMGNLWCRPCLYVGGKIDARVDEMTYWQEAGWLKDSEDHLLAAQALGMA